MREEAIARVAAAESEALKAAALKTANEGVTTVIGDFQSKNGAQGEVDGVGQLAELSSRFSGGARSSPSKKVNTSSCAMHE